MTEKKNKSAIQRRLIPTYIFLIIVSFISVFPLYWMISAATNTTTDVSRGRILPGTYFMEKTMLRRVMVGLTILVIALGVANVVRANVSSKGSCSFKSSVSAAEISE